MPPDMYQNATHGFLVRKLDEITFRMGAIFKETVVEYLDTRDNTRHVRRKAEFERQFRRVE
jgi:hypothetical protein